MIGTEEAERALIQSLKKSIDNLQQLIKDLEAIHAEKYKDKSIPYADRQSIGMDNP